MQDYVTLCSDEINHEYWQEISNSGDDEHQHCSISLLYPTQWGEFIEFLKSYEPGKSFSEYSFAMVEINNASALKILHHRSVGHNIIQSIWVTSNPVQLGRDLETYIKEQESEFPEHFPRELWSLMKNGEDSIPRNVILQGPPGTGKTHMAHEIAKKLVGAWNRTELIESYQFKMVQFHPATTYEDFVCGIRAKTTSEGKVSYEVEHGALSEMCRRAKNDSENNYVLVIDEINRANLPAVLGESIFSMEWRGQPVDTPYEIGNLGSQLEIPKNLWLIGTMNTADRSVGHLDYAVRRRFVFVDCWAKDVISERHPSASICFAAINQTTMDSDGNNSQKGLIPSYLSADFNLEDVQIGHTFFMGRYWKTKIENQVIPLLKEYVRDGVLEEITEVEIENKVREYLSQ